MPKFGFRLLIVVAFCAACAAKTAECQDIVSEHFPQRQDLTIVCWSIPEQADGYLSQVAVLQIDEQGDGDAFVAISPHLCVFPKNSIHRRN